METEFTASYTIEISKDKGGSLLEIQHEKLPVYYFEKWKMFLESIDNKIPTKTQYVLWLCGLHN